MKTLIKTSVSGAVLLCTGVAAFAQDIAMGGVVFQSDTFMQTFQDGMQAAADENDVTLILANSETDLAKESNILNDLIVRGIDALVINTFAADGSVAAVSEVVGAGIPVICANTCLRENARDGIHSFLATRNVDLGLKTGEAASEYIHRHLGGKAIIGILNCDTFPEACLPRKEGFLQALTEAGVEYEVVSDQTGFLADAALPISEAMLQANPDINILWAANEGGTTAHVLAVQGAGLADDVKVFGTDMSGQHAQFLKADNNILQAVTGQAPFQIGYDAVNLALDVIAGKEVVFDLVVPTILFARGDDEAIDMFTETDGRAVF
ncbi:MAG: substrate-binding domain-containing protein [Rhodobacteraceae bacterium]|nr:substrate-binding domain-containing protein [Paracoccaceae bacterium]